MHWLTTVIKAAESPSVGSGSQLAFGHRRVSRRKPPRDVLFASHLCHQVIIVLYRSQRLASCRPCHFDQLHAEGCSSFQQFCEGVAHSRHARSGCGILRGGITCTDGVGLSHVFRRLDEGMIMPWLVFVFSSTWATWGVPGQ